MRIPDMRAVAVATRQVATKSALNPALWLCGLSTPICFAAAAFVPDPLNYVFLGIGALPLLAALRAYDFFMKTDPDRLQSERFLLERQMVARLGVKSSDGIHEFELPIDAEKSENPLLEGGVDQ